MTSDTSLHRATRRALLGAGLAAGAIASTGLAVAGPPGLDLASPAGKFRAFMLMRGALDDRLVIGFVNGTYYGVVDDALTPLYGVLGVTFSKYRRRSDGAYDCASYEVPYFTDLETGAALDTWTNPYTHELVPVPIGAFPASIITITPDLQIKMPAPPPGVVASLRITASPPSGQNVWFTEATTSSFTAPGMAKPLHYSDLTTIHAMAADLAVPGAIRVLSQTNYTSVVSWRPWLKMGDRPGHLMGNAAGRYGMTMDELPASWHAAATVHRPDVLANAAAPLDTLFADHPVS